MKTAHKAGAAGCIAIACAFIAPWEGLWTTAQIDTIGTGQPVTACFGATRAEIPTLKVGQKFTKQECVDLLIKSLPKYAAGIAPCIHVDIPDKVRASLLSAAYNAGPSAVCKSPMVAKINDGDVKGGCEAFVTRDENGKIIGGWYVHARGRVVIGLVNRRTSESELCMEGANEPKPKPVSFWTQLRNLIERT